MSDQTRAVHALSEGKPTVRTVNPAVQRGSTVLASKASALYDGSEQTYGRQGLATHAALSEGLAALEGAAGVRLYPSGLAAMTATLLALLKSGDEVLAVDCVYEPTRRFCDTHLKRYGVSTRYFDPALSAEDVSALINSATRVLILESPGSLTLDIQDVPALAAAARARGVISVIDSTWGAGLLYKPLALGVDISVQALTKYVGGHADVFMGSASANDAGLLKRLDENLLQLGWATSPDDAYQMLRGLRTLPTRLARHGQSALKIAEWLALQPQVQEVIFPPLAGSRGHALWRRDFNGANGLISIVLAPGPETAVHAMLDALRLFGLGFSWGGFESLAIPCDLQLARRQRRPNLPGPLVRFNIGLEDPDDLIADLKHGLNVFSVSKN